MRAPTRHALALGGLTLNWLDWGNAGAPLLLFLHGNRDHALSWRRVAEAFAADWRVAALDLRGHGDSDWSPDGGYLSSYHVLDVLTLLVALGDPPATVVGHSFGGNVAARLAAAFPERVARLALVDGFGPPPDAYAQWTAAGPARRTRDWVEQRLRVKGRPPRRFATVADAATRLQAGNPRLSHAIAHDLARDGLRGEAGALVWKCDPIVGLFAPEDFAADAATAVWPAITCPTLLCYGTESWSSAVAEDGRPALLANHRLAPIEGAGHWPQHDRFDAFVAALQAFLAEA